MTIAIYILTFILMVNCLIMVGVILVQRGKGGGLAGALGGGIGGESAFGARGASAAKKATVVMAVIFIVLSATIGYMRRIEREGRGDWTPPPVERQIPWDAPPGL
jgi:preprotein translocase subunit SecG